MFWFCDTFVSEGCDSSLSPYHTAVRYADNVPAAGRGVSALLFQKKKSKKLNMIDLKDFKTGLREIKSRIGSSLEEENLLGWPSKSFWVWVWVGV